MSGYHERIQGTDRLLRIRRMRKAVYAALLGLAALLMYARALSEGASLKPFFLPLDGILEVGLIMGLVGTLLGLYFKNLEIRRAVTDSQRYLMSKYSMSRAMTTAGAALVLGVLLLLPVTASGTTAVFTGPPEPVYLGGGMIVNESLWSPDAFGVGYVRVVHVEVTSGKVEVTILRNGRAWATGNVSAPNSLDLRVQPDGWSSLALWNISFRSLPLNATAALTFTLPAGVMPSLFSTVPFLLFLYFAASLGWWFGLRPIRDRTKTAALYAGTTAAAIDLGERVYVASPAEPASESYSLQPDAEPPPPPPPTLPPPPPAPIVLSSALAPAAIPRVEPRPAPPRPDSAPSFTAKGDTLAAAQQYPAAIVAYDEALRLSPGYLPALLAKAKANLALQQAAGALDAYRCVLAQDPGNEEALRGSARVLASQARWREGLETVDVFLRKRPNDVWALELKGDILTSLGRRPEALAAFEAAQAMDPTNESVAQKIEEVRVDVPSLLSRALIASASGTYSQALNLFDDILEVEPSNVNALIGKAVAYRRSGKPQEALNCLDLVLSFQPTNASALLNRGSLLVEMGDLENALETFDKLVSLSPRDEEAWAAQAEVFVRMGRDDDALRAYSEALKLNPGDEEIQRRIQELEAARSIHADVLQVLYKVRGVGPARAKALIDAGFRTAEDFRDATVDQLLAVKGITRRIADDLVKHFKDVPLVAAR